jgi:hypothetical protein
MESLSIPFLKKVKKIEKDGKKVVKCKKPNAISLA